MSSLYDWAEAQFSVVETDGASTDRVELVTSHDNEVWHTWRAERGDFKDPTKWVSDADSYLRTLANEFPTREIGLLFTAYTAQGEVLSRFPWHIAGKKKQGAGSLMDPNQVAMSQAFDNVALTMEKFAKLVNTQLEVARRNAETNANTMFQQNQLITLMRQNQAITDDKPEDPLVNMLSENSGELLGLAKALIDKWEPKVPGK